ncbi:MAG: dihydroorotate dehydrogenase electron transfer subunit [Desulfobulbaceae bacterium]|nr:dihydroorotate dehydrogenase electron transfer subunit [Desulfobulbaceae bacterium]
MSEFQEKAPIISKESLTGEVFRLTVHSPQIAESAVAGQFAMIRVQDSLDPLLRRPFSIHKTGADGSVSFLFKVVGKGTAMMAALQPGMELDLIGPLGRGFTRPVTGSFSMIGGGMGIAPLFFLAQQLLAVERAYSNPPVLLGAQTQAELLQLAEEFVELGFPVHTATDDGTLGHHGFVTELLDRILTRVQQVYVCGPMPMMRIVAQKCLKAGVACQVSLETHMACGLGACLGCTIPAAPGGYKHVCKDGPVFSAEEVLWTL